jgi:hypothetical protein
MPTGGPAPLPAALLDFTREHGAGVALQLIGAAQSLLGALAFDRGQPQVRVRSENLELYHGPVLVLTLPRCPGVIGTGSITGT